MSTPFGYYLQACSQLSHRIASNDPIPRADSGGLGGQTREGLDPANQMSFRMGRLQLDIGDIR